MKQLQLIISWDDFRCQLLNFVERANKLRHDQVNSVEEIAKFDANATIWSSEVKELFRRSFNEPYNQYVQEFSNLHGNNFKIPGHTIPLATQIQQAKGKIIQKLDYLVFNERILSVCDAVIRPDSIKLTELAVMSMKQKQQLLLEKLFILYDDYYYPVDELLRGNGIVFRKTTEGDEIAAILINMGLVDAQISLGGHTSVQLTATGVSFIEESTNPFQENYDAIQYSYSEMSVKLDEIKEELKRTDMGHEILYNELQELKELYKTLNKKNWGQLLKGKLLDVAISKLVDNSTIAFVYEAITNHKLKLL